MPFYTYIVIVLVYRNYTDLIDCIKSIQDKINLCKIIIVNAFYNNNSKKIIENIATEYNCDFINIDNKGYSYGNNIGINFALKKYNFKFIIISNPDIIVKQFDDSQIKNKKIIAPKIVSHSGKLQNPMYIHENHFTEFLIYKGFKKNNRILLVMGLFINKILNQYYVKIRFFHKSQYQIYAAHGSFVILSKEVVEKIIPLYDEKIFLFSEECVLAQKSKEYGFKTHYDSNIYVLHKEDGSMKFADFSINKELKKSNIYFYENYIKNNTNKNK